MPSARSCIQRGISQNKKPQKNANILKTLESKPRSARRMQPLTLGKLYVRMYVCMYVCMYVWMDGWMDVRMYV